MIVAASFDTNNPELWVNRGLSYGDGLFETMRLSKNKIPLLDFHLKRLRKDLEKLQLKDFNRANIEESLASCIGHGDNQHIGDSAVLKLLVFRASQARTYTPLTQDIEWLLTLDDRPQIIRQKSLRLVLAKQKISHQPLLAGIKHISRLEQVMLAAELNQHQNIDDLLFVDKKNHIIETTYQNVVLIKNNQLLTPKLNRAGVKGVALQWLKTKHHVQARHIGVEELSDCDGMMVCNSIRGFRLVNSIELPRKQCISFGTSQHIHDKINHQWDVLFNS